MFRKLLAGTAATAVIAGLMLTGGPAGAADPVTTIPVGATPRGAAISPDGTTAYVTGGTNLSVISLQSNTVTGTVPIAGVLSGVALSPDGARAYVAKPTGQVAVVNTATRTVVTSIAVGDTPYGIAVTPDGSRVLVTRRSTNKVAVIDTATNSVTGQVNVGVGPTDVAVSPDGTRAVVANYSDSTVTVVDLPAANPVATIPVGAQPYGVAIDPRDGVTAYVSSMTGGVVSVIGAGNTVLSTIPVPGGPVDAAVGADGQFLYVTQYLGAAVSKVKLSNGSIVAATAAGTNPITAAVSSDGSRLVTANFGSANATVVALAPRAGTDPAESVKGETATGTGSVVADTDAVTAIRCYYGTDVAAVTQGPRGTARSIKAVPATAEAAATVDVTCPFTSLTRGKTYAYVVVATDADGAGWAPEPVTFTTRPPKIAKPAVVRKKAKLKFTWTSTRSADTYQARIRKGGGYGTWRTVVDPKVKFGGLRHHTTYKVQLRAGNDSGYGPKRVVKSSTR